MKDLLAGIESEIILLNKINGTDKNYQVEARTRICDVLHDTRPVSTPFH